PEWHGTCKTNRRFLNSVALVRGLSKGKGGIMIFERFKKGIITLVLSAFVVLSAGIAGNSVGLAQDRRYRDRDRWDRRDDRDDLERVRRLDWQRQLRNRWNRPVRVLVTPQGLAVSMLTASTTDSVDSTGTNRRAFRVVERAKSL